MTASAEFEMFCVCCCFTNWSIVLAFLLDVELRFVRTAKKINNATRTAATTKGARTDFGFGSAATGLGSAGAGATATPEAETAEAVPSAYPQLAAELRVIGKFSAAFAAKHNLLSSY